MTITMISVIVNIVAMSVTIRESFKVKNYRKQLSADIRKLNLSRVAKQLERSQDEIRKLLNLEGIHQRGKELNIPIDIIQTQIDNSLSLIIIDGPDDDIRKMIVEAQGKLRDFKSSSNNEEMINCVYNLHSLVQDSISILNGRIFNLEGSKNE